MCIGPVALHGPTAAIARDRTPGAWTRPIDLGSMTSARALAGDAVGNVFVAGFVSGGSTNADAFVRKYDQSGNHIWTRQFGSSHTTEARAITVDDVGDIIA